MTASHASGPDQDDSNGIDRRPWLYLASRSPRRSELLGQLGLAVRPLIDDDAERAEALEAEIVGEDPRHYVVRVARAKAEAALARLLAGDLARAPVLAADTTVTIGGSLLAKPANADEAARMLDRLQGRVHRVLTAVAVGRPAVAARQVTGRDAPGAHRLAPSSSSAPSSSPSSSAASTGAVVPRIGRVDVRLQTSRVRMRRLRPAEIDAYIASGEPFGKAGAYAIQGRAAAFITRIEGSHSGIMGLPLYETAQMLRRAGLPIS